MYSNIEQQNSTVQNRNYFCTDLMIHLVGPAGEDRNPSLRRDKELPLRLPFCSISTLNSL